MGAESETEVRWRRTACGTFPYAALVDGVWWVLRLNSFPDHPLYTLFVDGRVRGDIAEAHSVWTLPRDDGPGPSAQTLRAITPLAAFAAYGSARGRPCSEVWCCSESNRVMAEELRELSSQK